MTFLISLLIVGNTLAYNPTLENVAINRQILPVKYEINKELNINEYECLLGVQYGYGQLIGRELYFIDFESLKTTKMLVVDVEQKKHFPYMKEHDILGDTNCTSLIHKKGALFIKISFERD